MRKDIQEATGPLQMVAGLQSGAEAAIHFMIETFDDEQIDEVILVDASHMQILCQQFSSILINTYRLPMRMIVCGSKNIVSNEGTTQGDNLAMSFYDLSAALLNYLLTSSQNVKDICLAET